MISKKKAAVILIVVIIVTNLITFGATNGISIAVGDKAIITKSQYNDLVEFSKLFQVRDMIKSDYVDKIDDNLLVEGAVRGLASGIGDPYTVYWDTKEYEANTIETEGQYAGVGLVVEPTDDDRIVVVSPIEDTPAEKAGVKSGDIIVKIDNKEVAGKDLDAAVALMRGTPGTSVTLTILREGSSAFQDIKITRANIVLKSVKGEMLDSSTGYIKITAFQANTAQSFSDTLKSLQKNGMKGLILDLRDNGGGLLDQCIQVANQLVSKGIIVYTIDNKGQKEVAYADGSSIDIPIVVLVNGGTASASEIVSGAVKDSKSGTLVGTRTFGKGLVQTIDPIGDGSAVKVTIARYYTPSGVCIQGKGIEPNIVIDLPDSVKQKTEMTRQEDVQLSKAIEVIKQQIK